METANSNENNVEDVVEGLSPDEQAYEYDFDDDLGEEDEELEDDVEDEESLEEELNEVRDKLQDEDEVRMTKEEFFKFLETAHLQMRNGDFEQKDLIAKTLFSKLYLDHKNRLTVLWKSEFDGLISSPNVHNGERCRELIDAADEMMRRLYNVVDWMFDHPEYDPKTKVIPKKDYPVLVDVTF